MGVIFDNVRQGFNLLLTPVIYYGVVASIALQLATWERGDRTQDKLQDQYANKAESFDFIIVGGGTAGSVLLNRLSQHYSVLLLEAGGEPHPLQFVPGLARSLVNHPQIDWMHKTVAQKKSSAFAPYKRVNWVSGKTLGGSGSLDFLMYLRGNPEDFDNWARITKDISWKYDNLLPHFQRAEDIVANSTDPGAHRHGGELRIQQSNFLPLAKEFVAAAKELGYPHADLNGHFTEGFDAVFSTIKKGERQLPVRAFLDPVRKRKTVTIRKFAQVTKIRFRNDNTAYGLEYERHGDKHTVYATREIILSAGAIGTPKILMLSGIGPKRHLEEFGIKNLVNLPVGQNLQDHVATYLGPFFINEPLSFLKDRDVTANSYLEYGTSGSGPLTSAGFQATGLVSSEFAKGRGEEKWPDLQLTLFASSVDNAFGTEMAHTHGIQGDILKKYYQHAVGKHSFHIVTSLGRPAGRGEIRLASRNFGDPLVINPKYLEDPWNLDVKAMVDGVKKAMRLVEGSTTFQNIGGHFTAEVLPGCEKTKFRSDEYFECYVRHYTVSMYNPVGTCAMGPVDSVFAVTDPKLRVIGTKNLRVIDASVMPSIVVGGTQASTIMIAEKGAQMILNFWSHHTPEDSFKHFTEVSNSNSIETAQSQFVPKLNTLKEVPILSTTIKTTTTTTSTTTPRSINFKTVSPFSVTIKTSSPSPIPLIPSNSVTLRPVTTPQPSSTTKRPMSQVPHVSFPIISSQKNLQNRLKLNKPRPIQMTYRPLPKLHFFPSSKPTPKPKKYRTTTEKPIEILQTTQQPQQMQIFAQNFAQHPETTTPYPYELSTISIQPAELTYDLDNLTATTYRPMPADQVSEPKNQEQPNLYIEPQDVTKSMSFGKSILYLVEKKRNQQHAARPVEDFTYLNQNPINQPIPNSRFVPPTRETYKQYYKQTKPIPPTNTYTTIPQFDYQNVDEGYINDRYVRNNNRHYQPQQNHNQMNLRNRNRTPTINDVREFLRSATPTERRRTHYSRPDQQIHIQQQQNQQDQIQQQSRQVPIIQPANILYYGSGDSLTSASLNVPTQNSYQRPPLLVQEYPVSYSYY